MRRGRMVAWFHHNLFANHVDAIITLVTVPLCAWLAFEVVHWAIRMADWSVVTGSIRVLLVGLYPADSIWRVWIAALVLFALLGASLGSMTSISALGPIAAAVAVLTSSAAAEVRDEQATVWLAACGVATVAGLLATALWSVAKRHVPRCWAAGLVAILAALVPAGMELWGGLLLSFLLTMVTSLLSLPIGILLAFGRRSRTSSVRVCCTVYIEVMRSIPLILVVYCVWIVVPLLSADWSMSDVLRGMVGFVAFFSAYVAEYVRSGLQAVPRGQVEAARSIGMGPLDVNLSIVLPQAIRVVVPALVGNVLDIFNAAPLVFIIGLTDFLRAGQMVLANPQFSSRTYEVYAFLFAVYFGVGSLITFSARRLEAHLGKGAR